MSGTQQFFSVVKQPYLSPITITTDDMIHIGDSSSINLNSTNTAAIGGLIARNMGPGFLDPKLVYSRKVAVDSCAEKVLCALQREINTAQAGSSTATAKSIKTFTEKVVDLAPCICASLYDYSVHNASLEELNSVNISSNEQTGFQPGVEVAAIETQQRINHLYRDQSSYLQTKTSMILGVPPPPGPNRVQSSDRPAMKLQVSPPGCKRNTFNKSMAPGYQTPKGLGVDIKHNSYDRYLNRVKGNVFLKKRVGQLPLHGNKITQIDAIWDFRRVATCTPCLKNNSLFYPNYSFH